MYRFFSSLFLLAGIAGLAAAGWVTAGMLFGNRTPMPVTLAAVERGEVREGAVVALKELMTASVMAFAPEPEPEFFSSKIDTQPTLPECLFYPVIAENHAEYSALEALANRYGGFAALPGGERYRFRSFAVVVRDFSRHSSGELASGLSLLNVDRGEFFGTADKLPTYQFAQLFSQYPGFDVNRLYVIDIDREHYGILHILLALCVSASAFLIVIAGARFAPLYPLRPRYHGLGLRNPLVEGK